MAYDLKLSNKVSLSRILDELLDTSEQVSVVLSFLMQHDDEFKDIIKSSLNWHRIFQLDFILQCNEAEVDYIVKKLKFIPGHVASYAAWQVCNSGSKTANALKYKFKKEFDWILTKFNTPYPCKGAYGKSIFYDFDVKIINACIRNDISHELNNWSNNAIFNYISDIDYSLMIYRVLQYDVFCNLSDDKKYIFLTKLCNKGYSTSKTSAYSSFILQIIASNEELEVKKLAYLIFDKFALDDELPDNDIHNSETFSEFWLKQSIYGNNDIQKSIITFLINKRFDILHDWIAYDKTTFVDNMNAIDLIEYLYEENKKSNSGRKNRS